MIYDCLNGWHLFAPDAPDDIWSARRIARDWGVPTNRVYGTISELDATLGEKEYYRFGGKPSVGYNVDKRAILRQALGSNGIHPKASV